ncbi:MAG: N-acetylmuramoyl-L-alanine amidase [Anaerolineae bacterium]|nr:N-acetylmuramoyl-L-alanine amidase [Anaerolineae bacterium]
MRLGQGPVPQSRPLAGKRVVLDPGHGWRGDSGAYANGLREADVVLDVAFRTQAILQAYGAEVGLTRTSDEPDVGLEAADDRANAFRPDVVVSIHANAGGGTGTESCYVVDKPTSGESLRLASLLTTKVSERLGLRIRGNFPENQPGRRCGNGHYLYIHWMDAPAAIIELAFVDGPLDNDVAKLRERRQDFAQAIADAVVAYFSGQSAGGPPSGYTFCAWENERCNFNGTADVAYGANGVYAFRERVSGGIDCNNGVFGDPIRGVRKACYVRPVAGQPDYTPPPGYTFCAWENERCNFNGTANVAYGANGTFNVRERVSGGIDCNNGVFGDPIRGVRKACYVRPVAGQPDYTPPPGYTFCAWENERCNFSGTADVAYGANGTFNFRERVSGGIDCTNGVFGDPLRGVRKACFMRARADARCTPNADQTALFVDAGFSGQCVVKGYGEYRNPGAIGLPNDSLSSIVVGSNVQVVLCEHDDYGGVCETFTANDDNLSDNRIGNDRVSSLRVERRGGSGGSGECGGQYRAAYFPNRTLSGGPTLVRCEGWPIRHDWAGGSPGSGVPDDSFSARWTARARFDGGSYTFIARADDGVRVWLDGVLILDGWRDQSPTEYRTTRNVSAGDHDVRVEYYENGGGALIEFRWERSAPAVGCSGQNISLEQRVEGRLSNAAPSVSYCLRGSAGQIISARMFTLGADSLDTFLKVWSPNGQLLAENDDGLNIGYNSFLSVRLPQDGVYRVEATRYGSTEGRYALRVERGFQAAVGDLDRDCDVDYADRDRLMSVLGRADEIADLDLDGVVSTRDATFQSRNLGVRCQ